MNCFLMSFLVLALGVHAQSTPDDGVLDDMQKLLDSIVNSRNLKGAAVVMLHENYKAPLVVVSGIKNCVGDKVDKDTAFMLASASKPYAGLAAAIAVEKGLISSIDADVNDYFSYSVQNPSHAAKKVTLRHFLTHRSGMVTGAPYLANKEPSYGPVGGHHKGMNTCPLDKMATWYNDLLVNRVSQSGYGGIDVPNWFTLAEKEGGSWAKQCAPGQCWEYSNIGAGMVGAAVEEALKKKGQNKNFQQFCKENIFDKLGMTNTAWFSRDLKNPGNEAYPHEDSKCIEPYCFADYPSGSVRTSANDLALYLKMLVNEGEDVISKESWQKLTTCAEKNENGGAVSKENCQSGYMWFTMEAWDIKDDHKYLSQNTIFGNYAAYSPNGVYHDGAEAGVTSQMLVLPAKKAAIAFVTNSATTADIAIFKQLILAMPATYNGSGAPTSAPVSTGVNSTSSPTTSSPTTSSPTTSSPTITSPTTTSPTTSSPITEEKDCKGKCAGDTVCNRITGKCGYVCPATLDCCSDECNDTTLTECVGAFDSFCGVAWDTQCRDEAIDRCDLVC